MNCQTVLSLVRQAYVYFANGHFNPWTFVPISGGPAWIESERYEIDAEADGPRGRGAMNGPMLQALMEDRFNLKIHRVTREGPIYSLTAGKRGLKLQPAKEGICTAINFDNPLPLEPGKALPLICGMARITADGFDLAGATVADFCRNLGAYLDRPVEDRTGIAGRFDFHLSLTATDLGYRPRSPDDSDSAGAADPLDVLSNVRAGVGRIGLGLESAKGPRESLVIDSVDRPSPN